MCSNTVKDMLFGRIGGKSSMGVPQQFSFQDFPWNKPSSELGVPPFWEIIPLGVLHLQCPLDTATVGETTNMNWESPSTCSISWDFTYKNTMSHHFWLNYAHLFLINPLILFNGELLCWMALWRIILRIMQISIDVTFTTIEKYKHCLIILTYSHVLDCMCIK